MFTKTLQPKTMRGLEAMGVFIIMFTIWFYGGGVCFVYIKTYAPKVGEEKNPQLSPLDVGA